MRKSLRWPSTTAETFQAGDALEVAHRRKGELALEGKRHHRLAHGMLRCRLRRCCEAHQLVGMHAQHLGLTTVGRPSVRVPVFSNTRWVTDRNAWNASPVRMMMATSAASSAPVRKGQGHRRIFGTSPCGRPPGNWSHWR